MTRYQRVTLVGVGLIGGSIGLALRQRKLAGEVVGVGRRRETLESACALGAIDRLAATVAEGACGADLVVICTPVGHIVEAALEAIRHGPPTALVTDAGSTKAGIVRAIERAEANRIKGGAAFVGSHPMAGSEKTGPEHAQADLFEGRVTLVTPTERTAEAPCQRVCEFWQSLGSSVVQMSPERHDEAVAAASHVPHLVAAALAAATPLEALPITAGGWRDCTRVAGGDVEMWRQIFQENRLPLLAALGRFEELVAQFRRALEEDDQTAVARLLQQGKDHRDALGN